MRHAAVEIVYKIRCAARHAAAQVIHNVQLLVLRVVQLRHIVHPSGGVHAMPSCSFGILLMKAAALRTVQLRRLYTINSACRAWERCASTAAKIVCKSVGAAHHAMQLR